MVAKGLGGAMVATGFASGYGSDLNPVLLVPIGFGNMTWASGFAFEFEPHVGRHCEVR